VRSGETVLEIGGGIGELELELLRAGAESATNVELVGVYEEPGKALLEEEGFGGRIDWRYGDVVVDADLAPAADVVVLNRVVCCYPDMPALVDVAAAKTRRTLALSFPRDRLLTRLALRAINVWYRMRRSDFRFFVHAPSEIVATATARGLRLVHEHSGRFWQIAALERT
jgi:magnesium-protoporphyrin O-methyltransferase